MVLMSVSSSDAETESLKLNAFWGSVDHIHQLESRKSGVRVRWDKAYPSFCQHQKSWLIDAGDENEIAFAGGINLNPNSMVVPGHHGAGQNHDVYVKLLAPRQWMSTITLCSVRTRQVSVLQRVADGGTVARPTCLLQTIFQGNVVMHSSKYSGLYTGIATPMG